MSKRKTNEEFYKEVYSINSDIEVSGLYINGLSKMNCKCKICEIGRASCRERV